MPGDMSMTVKDYNLLTKKLLSEGYTAKNHPDYAEVCRSAWGKELWQNIAGGFEYTVAYLSSMVFRTGCGLLVEGSRFTTGHLSYMGIEWIPENDNPVITCPYRKDTCSLRNPLLGGPEGGGLAKAFFCDCHRTDEPYSYERSLKKAVDEQDREIREKYNAYGEKVKGHMCYWHMYYNQWTGEWSQKYDPMVCAHNCQRVGGICDLTHKPVSRKRGNVFYDVKTSYIRRDGTLFDGEEVVSIKKGIRLFETGKSITICEQVAANKKCREELCEKIRHRYIHENILYGLKAEVMNIHAQQRESRDLMQDLEDISAGIEIVHASDVARNQKEEKKQRRQQAQENRVRKLEKKILEIGYSALEEYSLDRVHADKWLGAERIEELEKMRQERLRQEKEKPVQMSLSDLPGWGT